MPIDAIRSPAEQLRVLTESQGAGFPSAVGQLLSAAVTAQQDRFALRESPLAQGRALGDLSERLETLRSTASQLDSTGLINNAFSQRTATSSNSAVLSARVTAGAAAGGGATDATYAIEVSSRAAAQVNTGNTLSSTAASSVQAGTNTLQLTVGGVSRNIDYQVSAGTSNNTALGAIADAINRAGAGVTAQVARDGGQATSRLVLTADQTGTGNAFSISDVTGDAVAASGIGSTSTAAANASYKVNGVSKTSTSNTVYLDNAKLEVTLKGTSSSAVNVSVGADSETLRSRIDGFVDAFNDLQSFSRQHGGYFRAGLSEALTGFARRNASALSEVGVSVGRDGGLSVDSSRLDQALSSDLAGVRSAFGGVNGVATRSSRFASNLQSTPSDQLIRSIDTRTGNAPGLEAVREEFLKGSIVNLFV